MKTPDFPANESQRLKALRNLRVLDTAPEEKLDRLTGLVKAHFKSSIALISMVDADRQWFKARLGLQVQETSRDVSFCGHAILSDEILWIEDATQDSRFAENPLVTGAPNIRFYAGAPLAIRPGLNLGTLCVIDTVPRPYSQADAKILGEFAKCVAEELSERRAVGILADAIEAIPEGFAIFDEDDRLFACNDAYRKIYAKSLPTIHKGALFKDIVRYGTEHGEYPEAGDTAADHTRWIDRCLDHHLNASGSVLQHTHSAGWLRVDERKTPSGMIVGFHTNVTDLVRAQEELKKSEATLSAILDTVVDAVVTINIDGAIVQINDAAKKLFGYEEDELIGKNVSLLMPAAYGTAHKTYIDRYLNTGQARIIGSSREVIGVAKSGANFELALTIGEVKTHSSHLFTGILRDIREQKRIDKIKREFVSTVSHELRTPLTSISGALSLLSSGALGSLPPQAGELVQIAERNASRLIALVNDILDIEKIELGKMEFRFSEIALYEVVQQAISNNEMFGDQYGVTFHFSSDLEAAAAIVAIDPDRIAQVLTNLLSNAAKFSPKGAIVEVALNKREDWIKVSVTDQGSGIPKEFYSKIFSKFARADNSDAREKGGTGLGLAICKAIVERHSGRINFQSELGKGSSFFFELPMVRSPRVSSKTEG